MWSCCPSEFHVKPPTAARELFGDGDRLASIERYEGWLAGAGIERGLLGPREADRLWDRHLLNSAMLAPFLPPGPHTMCDLGSGAGLPGVVLALLRADADVVLLEPLLRRATFLGEVVADLPVPNARVVRARAEDYARDEPGHDIVVARAVAPLERLARWALPLLRPGGRLLALKGQAAPEEVAHAVEVLGSPQVSAVEVQAVTEGDTVTHVVTVVRGERG